jgi:hypothetical protein
MLSMNAYPATYVASCRAQIEAQLAAYRALIAVAREQTSRSDKSGFEDALASFEPLFLANLVLVLDHFFVHRTRALEKKDGNPLNEVRMLCNSILQDGGVLTADKTIKFDPPKSVLKREIGDVIRLTETDFVRLYEAYFAEIDAKFTSTT